MYTRVFAKPIAYESEKRIIAANVLLAVAAHSWDRILVLSPIPGLGAHGVFEEHNDHAIGRIQDGAEVAQFASWSR